MGGIYLGIDVEILSADPFEKYLYNTAVFDFENSRSINTGLIYTSEKKNNFTQKSLDEYDMSIMNSKFKTNTKMNRKHFEQEYLKLCWDESSQQVENSYFIDAKEYSEIMRHYGTRSWLDVSYVIKKGKSGKGLNKA